jgi:ABC-2 type transport system permease protein
MFSMSENIRKEIKRAFNVKNLLIAVAAPLAAAIFFSFLYSNEIARDLPIGIIDSDNSELSRTIVRYLDASNYMQISKTVDSFNQIENELSSGRLEAVFFIPKNLEKNVKAGIPENIVVYKNTANIVTGNMILKDASTIIRTVSAGIFIKKNQAKGESFNASLSLANPINIESKPLFNETYSYSFFLVPGLIFVTLQLAVMLSSVISNDNKSSEGEGESNFFSRLIVQLLIQYINLAALLLLILPFFNFDFYNNFFPLFILFTLLIITSASLSIFISTVSNNELLNTEIVLLLNTPAFLFCGLTYPLNLMPDLHNWFAQIIPFTHFLEGLLKTNYMNSSIFYAAREVNLLIGYTLVILIISYFVINQKKKKRLNS